MLYLNFETATRLIEEAITVKGEDYVYESLMGSDGMTQCMYMHGSQPGCIIGHVLHSQGIDPSPYEGSLAGLVLRTLQSADRLLVTNKAAVFLEWVQVHQDDGVPWGESYRRALSAVGEMPEVSE